MLYPVLTESRGLMDLSGIWAFKIGRASCRERV